MAFRSVLAKLGNNCVKGSERRRLVAAFDTRTLLKNHNIWDDDEYQQLMNDRIEHQRGTGPWRRGARKRFRFLPHRQPTDNPNVMAYAHLAVEEFNKQKNAQLQFVRAVKAYCQEYDDTWGDKYYYLTLEAVDAEVVKTYQAVVHDSTEPSLHIFGLVTDNGLLQLTDNHVLPALYYTLDEREVQPKGRGYSDETEIEVTLQTRGGYFLQDEILGSLHGLPSQ
ncbi:hypothetical protein ABKV19_009262 [Rosa sericea]